MVLQTRSFRGLTVLLIGAIAGNGCVSVGVRPPEPLAGGTARCSIEVNVYEYLKDRKANRHTPRAIVSELWRKEKGGKTLVREAREAHWSVTDLEPSTYLVRVKRWVDGSGQEHKLSSTDSNRFAVAAGNNVRVDVVLKHPGRVVAVCVVVAVVGGLIWWASSQVMAGFSLGPM
jgi:hypothetical protein